MIARAAYRTPGERSEWRPRVGDAVVLAGSEWALSWGHAGKEGTVVHTSLGWYPYTVRCAAPPHDVLYVRLDDLAPKEEALRG